LGQSTLIAAAMAGSCRDRPHWRKPAAAGASPLDLALCPPDVCAHWTEAGLPPANPRNFADPYPAGAVRPEHPARAKPPSCWPDRQRGSLDRIRGRRPQRSALQPLCRASGRSVHRGAGPGPRGGLPGNPAWHRAKCVPAGVWPVPTRRAAVDPTRASRGWGSDIRTSAPQSWRKGASTPNSASCDW
jgi:hypothetical protein